MNDRLAERLRRCWPLFAILCVLSSLLVPGIASASTASGAETRVRVVDLAEPDSIGLDAARTPDPHRGAAPTHDYLAAGSLLVPRGTTLADDAFTHGYSYHPRIRARGLQDPKAHNFPYSFDDVILRETPVKQADGSLLYRKAGTLNKTEGAYEIAVNPETGAIFHRTFLGN